MQQDAGVALVNISLYEPARAALLKQNIVAALSDLLQGNDVQQEVGLALLQNISLYAGSHAELLQGGILARITPFLSGGCNAHVFMRGKACAVLQHLSANPDNARDLLRVGAVGLLTL